jgi:hypothetical protein
LLLTCVSLCTLNTAGDCIIYRPALRISVVSCQSWAFGFVRVIYPVLFQAPHPPNLRTAPASPLNFRVSSLERAATMPWLAPPRRSQLENAKLAAAAGALPATLKLSAALPGSGSGPSNAKAAGARSLPATKRKQLKEEVRSRVVAAAAHAQCHGPWATCISATWGRR